MRALTLRVLVLAAGLSAAAPALAMYKIVGPDGRITYTDRPQPSPGDRVTAIARQAPAAPTAPSGIEALPVDMRQVVTRFPVILYTSRDCPPCDAGRRLLTQRGIPYTERTVGTEPDLAALERVTASRTVPSLTIGAQVLRGFAEGEWTSFLDAAGYPQTSRLPRNWQPKPATPLVPPPEAVAQPAAPAPAAPEPSAPTPPPPADDNPAPGPRLLF